VAQAKRPFNIGVIGGGIAGSTVALRFSELVINVTLFESGSSLVNGPPICHLHAGGNAYREILDSQCLTLLKEGIETARIFPHTINVRPTLIAIPNYDAGTPKDILPRLTMLKEEYTRLVDEDPCNDVLGKPEDYFKMYGLEDILKLQNLDNPETPKSLNEWMIPVSKHLDFDRVKFPIIMVQEYGWSTLRMASTVTLALDKIHNCEVKTNTKVLCVEECESTNGWNVFYEEYAEPSTTTNINSVTVDYLVNACGYQTGIIDDFVGVHKDYMVEFKASYVANWKDNIGNNMKSSQWPEIIIHGARGTPRGMAQLTPYPDGTFQVHGMTKDITLFSYGLVRSTNECSQPQLSIDLRTKLEKGWDNNEVQLRTSRAINHVAQFIPSFATACVSGPPLFGAQQIPGDDPVLRTASVSFPAPRYARVEIIKGSSAPSASDAILRRCVAHNLLHFDSNVLELAPEKAFSRVASLTLQDVVKKAEEIAQDRNLPLGLARPVDKLEDSSKHSGFSCRVAEMRINLKCDRD